MRVKVIASGSTGNCTYIETTSKKILIDAGISKKNIETELANINVSLNDINALLITHEHDDHIRSLGAVLRKTEIICYMSFGTYNAIVNGKNEVLSKLLVQKRNDGYIIILNRLEKSMLYPDILLDDVVINVLPTFHDAIEPLGFKIIDSDKSVVYLTDTGYVHNCLYDTISDADCYVLECNHDPYILMASDRSDSLKRRILSEHGHLSNEDAFVTLAHVMGDKTKYVFYAHISQECNLFEIIELTRKKVMNGFGIDDSRINYIATSPIATKVYEL